MYTSNFSRQTLMCAGLCETGAVKGVRTHNDEERNAEKSAAACRRINRMMDRGICHNGFFSLSFIFVPTRVSSTPTRCFSRPTVTRPPLLRSVICTKIIGKAPFFLLYIRRVIFRKICCSYSKLLGYICMFVRRFCFYYNTFSMSCSPRPVCTGA